MATQEDSELNASLGYIESVTRGTISPGGGGEAELTLNTWNEREKTYMEAGG